MIVGLFDFCLVFRQSLPIDLFVLYWRVSIKPLALCLLSTFVILPLSTLLFLLIMAASSDYASVVFQYICMYFSCSL